MPLTPNDQEHARPILYNMFIDSMETMRKLDLVLDHYFGPNAEELRAALRECLDDFVFETQSSRYPDPRGLILEIPVNNLIKAGFYGAQLRLKKRQITEANLELRKAIETRSPSNRFFKGPFKKWVARLNNFLGSLIPAANLPEALKEIKDALAGELPETSGRRRNDLDRTLDE